ncbi:GntR family transcriptional regulator [Paenibacillus sp. GYB003]|uniref:GntR family transcriptional regulator n=1 Tax=Paenibacillus sp. GYB003 TaxID=2994392 RepID=UPI002F96580C
MADHGFRYVEVKEKLIEEIGSMKPHDRLPSRTVLAETYKAARTTVERAISELIGEGYLYARDGSGTYVSEKRDGPKRNGPVSVGLIIPDIMHDTYPGILRGVEDVTHRHDISLVVCNTDNQADKQSNYIQKLLEAGINGIIIVPAIAGAVDPAPFYKLQELNTPIVFCNRGIDGIEAPKVVSNNFYGAYVAVKHLIEQGCRSIAYISRPMYSTSYERYQGYTSALAEARIPVREDYVMFEPTFETERQGYDSVDAMLRNGLRPDGIFCFNDGIALGAYEALTHHRLQVGKDVKLVGYDNTSLCERMPVKLSSVKFMTYQTGSHAAELMVRMLAGDPVRNDKLIVLQPELVVRDSSVMPQLQ